MTYYDEDEGVYIDDDGVDVDSLRSELETTQQLLQEKQQQLEMAERAFIDSYLKPIRQLLEEMVQENDTLSQDVSTLRMEREEIENQLEILTVDLADKNLVLLETENARNNAIMDRDAFQNYYTTVCGQVGTQTQTIAKLQNELTEQKTMTGNLAKELDQTLINLNNHKKDLFLAKSQLEVARDSETDRSGLPSRVGTAFISALILTIMLCGIYAVKQTIFHASQKQQTELTETK